ncbi:MAG TPA: hypothetical protein VMV24_01750, partial [Candidatus Dormibacteraeota bacterium]|nr:hypothetical protein [Candidatus Dormibacteraeota bacterium]
IVFIFLLGHYLKIIPYYQKILIFINKPYYSNISSSYQTTLLLRSNKISLLRVSLTLFFCLLAVKG